MAPEPPSPQSPLTKKGADVGEMLLKQGMALLVLLVFGGLLAALSALLPRWGNAGEGPPEPRGLGLGELPQPAAPREAPPPPPPPPGPAPTPVPREASAALEDEHLVAAAVGLALALYQQEAEQIPAWPATPERGASPWVVAGRWQAMHRRLSVHRR